MRLWRINYPFQFNYELMITGNDEFIVSLQWHNQKKINASTDVHPPEKFNLLLKAIAHFLQGNPEALNLFASSSIEHILDLTRRPPFHQQIYHELLKTKPGEAITYTELAKRAGSPRGARAAASAMARNPFVVLVPCHRVVGITNKTAYTPDTRLKTALLQIEGEP